ncbi:kinase-like domain-containing protein [Chaetomium fimeti]|uniref:Kinase-like domain-containing protein n=1 Tax=Chaetomium fimeti TaxID=1854472 RepID=A0AAE0LNH9_9PEZI|nr:kinase-like domain-containing protein [Chaetomium fimeti]
MGAFFSTVKNPKNSPTLSLRDLTIVETRDRGSTVSKFVTFYWASPEEEVYFGQLFKNKKDITLSEYNAALAQIPDSEIYPRVPEDIPLTLAPDDLDNVSAFIKRPGLNWYDLAKGTDSISRELLGETLAMERISKTPHPHIIRYLGCRVRRGRITSLFVERLDQTLTQYIHEPGFAQLDKSKFVEALDSAVAYLHSLGCAHNAINPDNIMVRDGMPVLIDFGSCRPYGERLQSAGTPGWYEKDFNTSEAEHDTYSLKKLREWLEKPE